MTKKPCENWKPVGLIVEKLLADIKKKQRREREKQPEQKERAA
jgi:hypothetical protein